LPGGGAFNDDDLKPVSLMVDGSGAHWWANNAADREHFQEVSLEISYTGPLSLWRSEDKTPLEWSYPIGASGGSDVPDTIYVEGIELGEGSITWELFAATDANPSGEVVASATAAIEVGNNPPDVENDVIALVFNEEAPDTPVQLHVLANDYDPDGDNIVVTDVSATERGADVFFDPDTKTIGYTLPPESPTYLEQGGEIVLGEEIPESTEGVEETTDPGGFEPFQDTFNYVVSDLHGATDDAFAKCRCRISLNGR
jgi:hypothetical protein